MHDFYYFLYLGRLFIHLNIIIQVSQHSSIFFYMSTTMLTSAFNCYGAENDTLKWHLKFMLLFVMLFPWTMKKETPFLLDMSAYCIASHVASDPPPPPRVPFWF